MLRKNFITAVVAKTLRNPAFVDCRWSLKEPTTYGPAEYAKGHLPNAIFADVDNDLAAPCTEQSGRHPLPKVEDFAKWLKTKGLQKEKNIICYDDHGGSVAARLWWMLRSMGYPNVTLLDGGIQAWQREGLPLDTQVPEDTPVEIEGLPSSWEDGHMPIFSVDEMVDNIKDRQHRVVDARPAPRFASKDQLVWPDPISGHYPGAVNWPWPSNLTEDKQLRPLEELRALADAALHDHSSHDAVFHCGSGVTACFNIAVAEEVGLGVPRLYVGSWSEWCNLHPDKVEYSS